MLSELLADLREGDDRPALRGVSRGDLGRLVSGYAAALHAHGLVPGDTVGLAARPGPHALGVLLAGYRLGLRTALLDPDDGLGVLLARLAPAQPNLVLADAATQTRAGRSGPPADAPLRTIGRRLPRTAPALAPAGHEPPPAYDGDGDAVINFTSGTTGEPRAVVHTRASLSAGVSAVHDLIHPEPGRPVLADSFLVLLPALAAGAPVAFPARRPAALSRQIGRLNPQVTYLPPARLWSALAAGARFTGRVYSGSAPVSAALLRAVRNAGAAEAWSVYTLAEIFPAAAVESTAKTAFTDQGDLVGALLPHVSATPGELRLRGPHAADRYLGGPPFGWVTTGDVGQIVNDRVILAGRAQDTIRRGTETVQPGLYEPSLHVAGVGLAVLVGVPAATGDEKIVALVQPAPGADPAQVRAALTEPLSRLGPARPDAMVLTEIPLAGRSGHPDRAAAARLAATLISPGPPTDLDRLYNVRSERRN